jgi:hypothetical protein
MSEKKTTKILVTAEVYFHVELPMPEPDGDDVPEKVKDGAINAVMEAFPEGMLVTLARDGGTEVTVEIRVEEDNIDRDHGVDWD